MLRSMAASTVVLGSRRVSVALSAVLVTLLLSAFAGVPLTHASGPAPFPADVSGQSRWAILLCQFADTTNNPPDMQPPASFFEDLFTEKGAGKNGMFDYWKSMSYGKLDLTGSKVFGWFTMKEKLADHLVLGGANPAGRHDKLQSCITAASSDPNFAANAGQFYGVAAIWNDAEQVWGGGPEQYTVNGNTFTFGTAAFNPTGWDPAIVAQEMMHGYNLRHSRATDPDPTVDYMDPWDPMSAWQYGNTAQSPQAQPWTANPNFSVNHAATTGPTTGASGPSLNAGYRDMLGWFNPNQVTTLAAGGPTTVAQLADVDHPEIGFPLMVKISARRCSGTPSS
jgi:hypothetical protein